MVLKYISKTGSRIYGPPYTKAEEDELQAGRRWADYCRAPSQ